MWIPAIAAGVSAFLAIIVIVGALGGLGDRNRKRTLQRLDRALARGGTRTEEQVADIRKRSARSGAGRMSWLNRKLVDAELAPRMKLWLYQANLQWTPGRIVTRCIAAWLITSYVIYFRSGDPLPALLMGVPAGMLPFFYIRARRNARLDDFRNKLPEALDMIVGALRAGHSISSALAHAAVEAPEPVRSELRQCADEQKFGLELRNSLKDLTTRVPVSDLQIAVTAILIQQESGGNLAEVLEKVAQIMRERTRLKNQVRVHTAQGRLTGTLLSLAPVILGAGMYLMDPASMSILWTTVIGKKLLWTSGIMTTLGILIINKTVNIRV
jgi:tight adherence protein B